MDDDRMLSWLKWLGAGAGSLVPGYSYFTSYEPPLFHGVGLITGALAGALIAIVRLYIPRRSSESPVRVPCMFLASALIFLIAYVAMVRYWTATAPQENAPRFQVGFGKWEAGLTELGLRYKKGPLGSESIVDWMLRETAFCQGGPEKLWKTWSILAAGIIMITAYFIAFVCWTCGFALLAKRSARCETVPHNAG